MSNEANMLNKMLEITMHRNNSLLYNCLIENAQSIAIWVQSFILLKMKEEYNLNDIKKSSAIIKF